MHLTKNASANLNFQGTNALLTGNMSLQVVNKKKSCVLSTENHRLMNLITSKVQNS